MKKTFAFYLIVSFQLIFLTHTLDADLLSYDSGHHSMGVYFDYNATTPLHPIAQEAWVQASDIDWQNPAAAHQEGRRVKERLEQARARLAHHLGCEADQIVFNSGATEGNNTLISELSQVFDAIAISSIEHGSVRNAAKKYFGDNCYEIPVDKNGVIDLDVLEAWLQEKKVSVVSIMAVNNEAGMLQPWGKIHELCRQYGALYHCDASQWLGKLPSQGLFGQCDFVTGCAHKFYGPKGVGFIKVNTNVLSYHAFVGGGQEHGARAGTVNYPSIASMLAVLEAKELDLSEEAIAERIVWRDEFEANIKNIIPGAIIAGEGADRLWNTVCLVVPEYDNFRWVLALEQKGFYVSSGTACVLGDKKKVPTLVAMGFDDEAACRGLRISSGWETTQEAWQMLAQAFQDVWEQFEQEKAAPALATVVEI